MVKLKIDPEFRDKIPALTQAEFEQLRENILADGEVYEPIVTWNDTILDGHNRWKIVCENWELLKDKFRTKPMDFSDKWEAFEWMYKKQLGRRNLTDEQKAYMVGKMYEARKKSVGGQIGNANAKNDVDKMSELKSSRETKDGTAGEIGKEIGVDGRTVRRAEKFAKGIDALRQTNAEAAETVLKGNSGATKTEIAELPTMTAQEIQKVAQDILSGEIKKARPRRTQEDRDRSKLIESIAADMYNPDSVPEFTLDMLLGSIKANAQGFTETLEYILQERANLITDETRASVEQAIDKYVIEKTINIIKEMVNK